MVIVQDLAAPVDAPCAAYENTGPDDRFHREVSLLHGSEPEPPIGSFAEFLAACHADDPVLEASARASSASGVIREHWRMRTFWPSERLAYFSVPALTLLASHTAPAQISLQDAHGVA